MWNARTRSFAARFLARRAAAVSTTRTASTLCVGAARLAQPLRPLAFLPIASLACALTASVAFAKTMIPDSPEALVHEERFADHTYDRTKHYEDLKSAYEANPDDIGVAWRLVRATYDVSNLKKTSANEQKELIYYAYDVIQKTIAKCDTHASVHNWYGVILSRIGDFEGTKVAISNAYKIRDHWRKAIELDPTRSATFHLLGRWCMTVSDLSWVQRKAASVLFGSPPESSYDEALTYLLKCDEFAPGTWKKNAMLIATVYYKQKDWAKAQEWTEKTLAIPIKTEEDAEVHEEATALLRKF